MFELLGWIDVVLAICGLAICISYSRLSDRMAWLVLAFGISACAGAGMRLMNLAISAGLFARDLTTVIYTFAGLANVVASALLVFGLLGLFRELRERFQFMREAHESQREQKLPGDVPGPESIFEPTEPAR